MESGEPPEDDYVRNLQAETFNFKAMRGKCISGPLCSVKREVVT